MEASRVFAYLKAVLPAEADLAVVEAPLLTRTYLDGLIVTLAYDGDRFELLQKHHLADLALSEDEAFALGRANLGQFVKNGAVQVRQAGPLWPLIAGGNFEASLLLVDALWPAVAAHIGATALYAAAPARDLLAVVPASPSGAAAIDAWLNHVRTVPLDHRLTTARYEWRGTGWTLSS